MSWLLPSEMVKEKAREISHLLYGMTIDDSDQVMSLVKSEISRFSSQQIFAPGKQDERTREQFLADLTSQDSPSFVTNIVQGLPGNRSEYTAAELAKWSQTPMRDISFQADPGPASGEESAEMSLEHRDG